MNNNSHLSKKKQQQIHSINQAKWFHERHANRLKSVKELVGCKKLQEDTSPSMFDFLTRIEEEISLTAFCLENGYFNEKDIHDRLMMLEESIEG